MEARVPTLEMMLSGDLAQKYFEQCPEIKKDWSVILFVKGVAYDMLLEDALCFSCKVPKTITIIEMGEEVPIEWCEEVQGEIIEDPMTVRKCKGDYYR